MRMSHAVRLAASETNVRRLLPFREPMRSNTTGAGGVPPAGLKRPRSGLPSSSGASPQAFVSSHYRLGHNDVDEYLRAKGLDIRVTDTEVNVRECPFCRGARYKIENQFKLYFSRANGAFFCHRCGAKGNWFQFKAKLGDLTLSAQVDAPVGRASGLSAAAADAAAAAANDEGTAVTAAVTASRRLPAQDVSNRYPAALFKDAAVLEYLTSTANGGRGLSAATLRRYQVGLARFAFPASLTAGTAATAVASAGVAVRVADMAHEEHATDVPAFVGVSDSPAVPAGPAWIEHACVTFPWTELAPDGTVTTLRVKARSLSLKSAQRLEPKGGPWGLFGWHTVPADATELVITEGEYDAMAVFQATGRPAVSLPNGARSLPLEVLPQLERFKRIYLWMDDDVAGQEGAVKIAKKLGEMRVLLVHGRHGLPAGAKGPKDANDALRAGLDLESMIARAKPIPHEQIVSFAELREEILRDLTHPQQAAGVQSKTLPGLNRLLKGHRPGELTIVTGPTGSGKTSILSQLSLDYAAQGVPTLWGSFELSNVRLVKKMIQQYAAQPLEGKAAEFEAWADRFEQLPIYFMRFFGSSDVAHVLEAMEYAAYVNDVSHVVLDNLQFMHSGQGRGFEKFELLDRSIELLRKFATQANVHVSLVVHPRKVDDDQLLSTASVFGTAKATQEADNVIIVQRGPRYNFLDVRKNRFDGDLGIVPYRYDKVSGNVYEIDEAARRALDGGEAGPNDGADLNAYQRPTARRRT